MFISPGSSIVPLGISLHKDLVIWNWSDWSD